jgi:chemotaxis protein MotA
VRTTTYLGLLLGAAAVALAVRAGGGDPSILTRWPALLLVLGGTLGAATLASSRRTVLHALSAASRLLLTRTLGTRQVSEALVELARQARASGPAALAPDAGPLRDPFLRRGLHLLAEGVAPERLEELLRLESEILSERRAEAERLFRIMGRSALLFGMTGTLLALLQLPAGTSGPPAPAIAASLAAACYGLLLAGLVFLPLASKVRTLDLHEQLVRDQMVTGLLAIRLGQNPENLRDSLQAFAQEKG